MSLLGTSLKPRPPQLRSMTAICSTTQYENTRSWRGGVGKRVFVSHAGGDNGGALRGKQRWGKSCSFEEVFIRSLVAAGSCRSCREHDLRRRNIKGTDVRQKRQYSWGGYRPFGQDFPEADDEGTRIHERQEADADAPAGRDIPREEYRQLAETYDSPSDLWEQPNHNPASIGMPKKLLHMPLAPRLVLTPEQEDRPPHTARRVLPPEDAEHSRALARFTRLLDQPLGTSTTQIWQTYSSLPGPRPRYLTDNSIHRLFRHLTWVEFKSATSSHRYFTVLNEVLASRIPVHKSHWNSSIAFAARWIKNTSVREVKTAIETWLRMEQAGVTATMVTFNILFDAAIRAGRFGLADTICDEIQQRGLKLDRSFRTSMIYYAGLRKDGDAVRQAFRDLVDAGEIVDTLVMNCVIVSLVRAGEGASAENAFLKMKHLHETKFGVPGPRNWRERKMKGIEMYKTARELRRERTQHESSFFGASFSSDGKKEEAQARAPIHPDAHTYRILVRYNAYVAGDLDRCKELVKETKDGGWPVHGSVYLYLFRGFDLHGGHAYTPWNRRNLEEVWSDFLSASSPEKLEKAVFLAKAEQRTQWASSSAEDSFGAGGDLPFFPDIEQDDGEVVEEVLSHEEKPPFFTFMLARNVLSAFYKCAGRKRMLAVWAEVQEKWADMSESQRVDLSRFVERCVVDDGRYVE